MLSFNGIKIMLDCRAEWSQLLDFLPFSSCTSESGTDSKHLRTINSKSFIDDSQIRVQLPLFEAVDMSDVDVLLLSNCQSVLSLPFLTEQCGFRGSIYASEPTVQLGRELCFDLLVQVQERAHCSSTHQNSTFSPSATFDAHCSEPVWISDPSIQAKTTNTAWHSFYSEHDVHQALSKIESVSFNEIKVFSFLFLFLFLALS